MIKNAIFILEVCEEDTGGNLYDYDALPNPVKKVVDKALLRVDKSYLCNIYKKGLQFLMQYETQNNIDLKINPNETINYMGIVTLYNEN